MRKNADNNEISQLSGQSRLGNASQEFFKRLDASCLDKTFDYYFVISLFLSLFISLTIYLN